MNPCKNCLTISMCRSRILNLWNRFDFDKDATQEMVFHTLSGLALKDHCPMYRKVLGDGDLYDDSKAKKIRKTFNIHFGVST